MDKGTLEQIKDIGFYECSYSFLECDFCRNPEMLTFARMEGHEYVECAYWICGKCVLADIKKYSYKTNFQMLRHFDQKEKLPLNGF